MALGNFKARQLDRNQGRHVSPRVITLFKTGLLATIYSFALLVGGDWSFAELGTAAPVDRQKAFLCNNLIYDNLYRPHAFSFRGFVWTKGVIFHGNYNRKAVFFGLHRETALLY